MRVLVTTLFGQQFSFSQRLSNVTAAYLVFYYTQLFTISSKWLRVFIHYEQCSTINNLSTVSALGEVRYPWNTGTEETFKLLPVSGLILLLSGCEYCICGQHCCLLTRRSCVDLKKFEALFFFCF